MSPAETACHSTPQEAGLRVETLSFDQIPQQTRLFLDYLRDPPALRRFYPEAVRFHYDLSARAERVLGAYQTDRGVLCGMDRAAEVQQVAADAAGVGPGQQVKDAKRRRVGGQARTSGRSGRAPPEARRA